LQLISGSFVFTEQLEASYQLTKIASLTIYKYNKKLYLS